MHKAFSVCIPVTQEWTDDDVTFMAARLEDTLNKADLKGHACRIAESLFLHGTSTSEEPVGILNAADA